MLLVRAADRVSIVGQSRKACWTEGQTKIKRTRLPDSHGFTALLCHYPPLDSGITREMCVSICWGGRHQLYVGSLGLSSVLIHNTEETHPKDNCLQLAAIERQPEEACFARRTTGFQKTQLWGSKQVLPITSSTDSTISVNEWDTCFVALAWWQSPLHRTRFSLELLSVSSAPHQHNLS